MAFFRLLSGLFPVPYGAWMVVLVALMTPFVFCIFLVFLDAFLVVVGVIVGPIGVTVGMVVVVLVGTGIGGLRQHDSGEKNGENMARTAAKACPIQT